MNRCLIELIDTILDGLKSFFTESVLVKSIYILSIVAVVDEADLNHDYYNTENYTCLHNRCMT